MNKYRIKIRAGSRELPWTKRQESMVTDFFVIVNKVVSLGGIICLDKKFNLEWMNDYFFVKLSSGDVAEIDAMKQVNKIRSI